ncbi:nucleotide-binding universal stress UspA family protein [Desulfohalotomaculum tongense]|uniref:universal stress protein n=1 Tax=Desulforadius tongensis TaxID=1216062 RepID=UPI00195A7C08|nr:universal stress protein [Desulforadius tongensis]MBM7854867.1 nucleotide-binding universal stress UspA family protein [Desulforadius tongensis]
MYKNILLAMHGEEINIEKVMEQVLLLAEKTESKITLLNVKENNLVHYGEVDTLLTFTAKERFVDYIGEIANEQAEKVLDSFTEKAGQKGITFNWKTREGKPAEEIIKEIKEGNYDLLVLGTKAPGPGNTSSKVKERVAKEHLITVLMVK